MTERQAIILVDLGFGDAGKGTVTDFLSRELPVHTVVRYNGGSQAGHNIITPDGRHHTYSQFGSGTFIPEVRTHLSRFMLIDPMSMLKENRHLESVGVTDTFKRTTIERDCLVITPFHKAINRLRELARGENKQGTCGMGVSEAVSDSLDIPDRMLYVSDLVDKNQTTKKLKSIRDFQLEKLNLFLDDVPKSEIAGLDLDLLQQTPGDFLETCADVYSYFTGLTEVVDAGYLRKILSRPGAVVFEGAQGVLLDRQYGFLPFVTSTNTTSENADRLLQDSDFCGQKIKIGLMRSYTTRHGAGPFVTEGNNLPDSLRDLNNPYNFWQGNFRTGELDLVSAGYAAEATLGIDLLGIIHLDKLAELQVWRAALSYGYFGQENAADFFEIINGSLDRIKVRRPVSQDHQKKLAQVLKDCKPNYSIINKESGISGFVSFIEEKLQIPAGILSFGPTAGDKKFNTRI